MVKVRRKILDALAKANPYQGMTGGELLDLWGRWSWLMGPAVYSCLDQLGREGLVEALWENELPQSVRDLLPAQRGSVRRYYRLVSHGIPQG